MLAVGGVLLFRGDTPFTDDEPSGPDGFGFQLKGIKPSPTTRTTPSKLRDRVRDAGNEVKTTMDELYFRAFVDEGSWGDYEAAFELFEGRAATSAGSDVEVLTLGSTASDEFEALGEASGTLSVSVLTDAKDAPVSAVAQVDSSLPWSWCRQSGICGCIASSASIIFASMMSWA